MRRVASQGASERQTVGSYSHSLTCAGPSLTHSRRSSRLLCANTGHSQGRCDRVKSMRRDPWSTIAGEQIKGTGAQGLLAMILTRPIAVAWFPRGVLSLAFWRSQRAATRFGCSQNHRGAEGNIRFRRRPAADWAIRLRPGRRMARASACPRSDRARGIPTFSASRLRSGRDKNVGR